MSHPSRHQCWPIWIARVGAMACCRQHYGQTLGITAAATADGAQ